MDSTNEVQPEKFDYETIKKELVHTFGLFIAQVEPRKFVLAGALKEGEFVSIIPNPEELRIYGYKINKTVAGDHPIQEGIIDICTIKSTKDFCQLLLNFSSKYTQIKVIYSNDNCETIEEFFVPNLKTLN